MSKFRGVTSHKDGGFVAHIGVNGRHVYIGYFAGFEQAKQARLAAEVQHFGAVFDRREVEIDGDVVRVPLHGQRGVFKGWALVDAADLEVVQGIAWTTDSRGYVVGRPPGVGKPVALHRWLMPESTMVDHKNGDKMDNRRDNLRACTPAQNARNTQLAKNNTSGSKGVTPVPAGGWRARIWVDRRERHIGTYETRQEAEAAYDKAASDLHGEFASTNADLRKRYSATPCVRVEVHSLPVVAQMGIAA